jgi:ubiquinone/menaquinone biosynthesis C-methylase UbiE
LHFPKRRLTLRIAISPRQVSLMSATGYVLDSNIECDRLERQAALDGLERYLRHLPSIDAGALLDAGCGSGALSRLLASHRPKLDIVGVDLNPAYVAYASDLGAAACLKNVRFEQGNLQALRFPDASFDVIWSRFVLYFLPNPAQAIAEFMRVLRPAGSLIVTLHNWTTLINYPEDPSLQDRQRRLQASAIADMHLAPKLPSMLAAAGFSDVTVEIELDPIYSAVGSMSEGGLRNYSEVFTAAIDRVAATLGGRAEAERFIEDSLAYFSRPDTYTYSLLWTIKGVAPARPSL